MKFNNAHPVNVTGQNFIRLFLSINIKPIAIDALIIVI
jgi:hypothetical protein